MDKFFKSFCRVSRNFCAASFPVVPLTHSIGHIHLHKSGVGTMRLIRLGLPYLTHASFHFTHFIVSRKIKKLSFYISQHFFLQMSWQWAQIYNSRLITKFVVVLRHVSQTSQTQRTTVQSTRMIRTVPIADVNVVLLILTTTDL
jgi:hypothetical protein